jgi:hypothetical protein
MVDWNGIEPLTTLGFNQPLYLLSYQSAYVWCPRWDSNPHFTASKTADIFQLGYRGNGCGTGLRSRQGGLMRPS